MADANAQAPQDVANMANAAPATAPTIVNPVDSFFDDYQTAVEADKARRPKPRPRVRPVMQAAPADNLGSGDVSPEGQAKMRAHARELKEYQTGSMADAGVQPGAGGMAGPDVAPGTQKKMREYYKQETATPAAPEGWASKLSGEYGKAQQPTAKPAAPHVEAFGKAVAPVKLPSFVSAEKKPMNPKLDSVLASMDGGRLETMGQEFASTYFKDGGASGYKDDELQQVYLGVQEHLRDRVKKGYKLKTMDEARLFEED